VEKADRVEKTERGWRELKEGGNYRGWNNSGA